MLTLCRHTFSSATQVCSYEQEASREYIQREQPGQEWDVTIRMVRLSLLFSRNSQPGSLTTISTGLRSHDVQKPLSTNHLDFTPERLIEILCILQSGRSDNLYDSLLCSRIL
jgi:hypothetical protein